ncbi:MAG: TIGR04255 family protein [Candidatus Acidiferrales bacterium]
MTKATPERPTSPPSSVEDQLDFERPPVVETSIGFYFTPIQGWTILEYGLLREKFKPKYPTSEFNHPVGQLQVQFGVGSNFSNIPVRVCFVDSANENLVQVQNNFVLHNWRRSDPSSLYQHYVRSREALQSDWQVFGGFLEEQSLKLGQVVRCEASYFNHLVQGEDWQDFSELPRLFPAWKGTEGKGVLSTPQMIGFSAWYVRPQGMIQVVSQPALRQTDGKQIIQLTVTVNGVPIAQDEEALFRCLDDCHHAAVHAFAEFTSEDAQRRWGRSE